MFTALPGEREGLMKEVRKMEGEGEKELRGKQTTNTSWPWASGTNYTTEGMSVILRCSKTHMCAHTQMSSLSLTQADRPVIVYRSYTNKHQHTHFHKMLPPGLNTNMDTHKHTPSLTGCVIE